MSNRVSPPRSSAEDAAEALLPDTQGHTRPGGVGTRPRTVGRSALEGGGNSLGQGDRRNESEVDAGPFG
jgi:hypothetical protein